MCNNGNFRLVPDFLLSLHIYEMSNKNVLKPYKKKKKNRISVLQGFKSLQVLQNGRTRRNYIF